MLDTTFQMERNRVVVEGRELGFITSDSHLRAPPSAAGFLALESSLKHRTPSNESEKRSPSWSMMGEWEHALSLLLRFRLDELIDPSVDQGVCATSEEWALRHAVFVRRKSATRSGVSTVDDRPDRC